MLHNHLRNQGFSLLQISMLLAVVSIILVSVLPGGDAGNDLEKERITRERMEKVEDAMVTYMAQNSSRPCPSNITLENTNIAYGSIISCDSGVTNVQSFQGDLTANSRVVTHLSSVTGLAAGQVLTAESGTIGIVPFDNYITTINSPTTFTMSKPAARLQNSINFQAGSMVVGGVPVRDLGLPEEYGLDGYGRRMVYVVDKRATTPAMCKLLQYGVGRGDVRIKETMSATEPKELVMWALLSYGKDPHGAISRQGSSWLNRFHTGNTDLDTRNNAFATGDDFAAGQTITGVLVQKEPTSSFDDMVWYRHSTKNTCCVGKLCNFGTRLSLDNNTNSAGPLDTKIGDVNGDGFTDIVVGVPRSAGTSYGRVIVKFGGKKDTNMFNTDNLGAMMPSSGYNISATSGTLGFGKTLAVGDMTGDAIDDIAIRGPGYISVFFGRASNQLSSHSAPESDATQGFRLVGGDSEGPLAMGDVDGDGIKDLIIGDSFAVPASARIYVVFGRNTAVDGNWATPFTDFTNRLIDPPLSSDNPAGFYINTSDTTTTPLPGHNLQSLAVGDVTGDGYDDILFANQTLGRAYLVKGRTRATWRADTVDGDGSTTADSRDLVTELVSTSKAISFTAPTYTSFGKAVALERLRNNYMAIIISAERGVFGYYGPPDNVANTDLRTKTVFGSGFLIDTYTGVAAAGVGFTANNYPYRIAVGDFNHDDIPDIALGTPATTPIYYYDGANRNYAGTSYIVYRTDSFGGTYDLYATSFPGNKMGTGATRIDGMAGDQLFISGIADFDADGVNDLVLTSSGYWNGGSSYGTLYTLTGQRNYIWNKSIDIGCIRGGNVGCDP